MLAVDGVGAPPPIFGSAAVVLRRIGVVGIGRDLDAGLPPGIFSYSGLARATGGMLLEFHGPANRAVAWSIAVGAGNVAPLTDPQGNPVAYTDAYGRAWARYDAGGYSGPLTIEVQYGA